VNNILTSRREIKEMKGDEKMHPERRSLKMRQVWGLLSLCYGELLF
jgi:hypothetical protein